MLHNIKTVIIINIIIMQQNSRKKELVYKRTSDILASNIATGHIYLARNNQFRLIFKIVVSRI